MKRFVLWVFTLLITHFSHSTEVETSRETLFEALLAQTKIQFPQQDSTQLNSYIKQLEESEFQDFLEIFSRYSEIANDDLFKSNPSLAWEIAISTKGFSAQSTLSKIRPMGLKPILTNNPKPYSPGTIEKTFSSSMSTKQIQSVLIHCLSIKAFFESSSSPSESSAVLQDQFKMFLRKTVALNSHRLTQDIATELLMAHF
jgi:hypothetical protein